MIFRLQRGKNRATKKKNEKCQKLRKVLIFLSESTGATDGEAISNGRCKGECTGSLHSL